MDLPIYLKYTITENDPFYNGASSSPWSASYTNENDYDEDNREINIDDTPSFSDDEPHRNNTPEDNCWSPPSVKHGGDDALIRRKKRENWFRSVGKILGHIKEYATSGSSGSGSGSAGSEEIMMTPTIKNKCVRFNGEELIESASTDSMNYSDNFYNKDGILKVRNNNNLIEERARLAKCDGIGIHDFVTGLAHKQYLRRQMGNYFDNIRRLQLKQVNM